MPVSVLRFECPTCRAELVEVRENLERKCERCGLRVESPGLLLYF